VAAALIALLWMGCVSVARSEIGSAPEPSAIAGLSPGSTFDDVIAACGVPLETIVQPDGRLLIYRERHYTFRRLGFEPGLLAAFIDVTGFLRAAVANLELVLEWGQVAERRLVVLFDDEDRVAAIAYRDLAGDR